jgi:phosphatidylethanolamine/phosphatidyl-N-methylethanolamine N-methyltransferase
VNNFWNIRTYRRYAPFYDTLFGRLFHPGRQGAVAKLNCQAGMSVLEVGIGTGLSLSSYPQGVSVTGIDLSAEMLQKAHKQKNQCGHIDVTLLEMDAQNLSFDDAQFDKVVVMYVASVVPDAEKMMSEVKRVCKMGGDIVVVNHFSSEKKYLKWLEKCLQPLQTRIGFRADFPLRHFMQSCQLKTLSVENINLMGYWSLIHMENLTS